MPCGVPERQLGPTVPTIRKLFAGRKACTVEKPRSLTKSVLTSQLSPLSAAPVLPAGFATCRTLLSPVTPRFYREGATVRARAVMWRGPPGDLWSESGVCSLLTSSNWHSPKDSGSATARPRGPAPARRAETRESETRDARARDPRESVDRDARERYRYRVRDTHTCVTQ